MKISTLYWEIKDPILYKVIIRRPACYHHRQQTFSPLLYHHHHQHRSTVCIPTTITTFTACRSIGPLRQIVAQHLSVTSSASTSSSSPSPLYHITLPFHSFITVMISICMHGKCLSSSYERTYILSTKKKNENIPTTFSFWFLAL